MRDSFQSLLHDLATITKNRVRTIAPRRSEPVDFDLLNPPSHLDSVPSY